MRKLVSVCIPAYRQPELLLRAVRSVLCQRDCDFEVVITDDSPDDEVLTGLGAIQDDPKVRYFKNDERLGAVSNWNESIRRAEGEVIKILHHDDWLTTPSSLTEFAEPILADRVPVVFSACRAMQLDETELFQHRAPGDALSKLRRTTDQLAFTNFLGPPSIMAFDRRLGIEFDTRFTWLSDVQFYIRILEKANYRFEYIDQLLVNTTAESPLQLSRNCENDKVGTFIEYITLFSEQPSVHGQWRDLFACFSAMGTGLNTNEKLSLLSRASRTGRNSVLACLIAAILVPRRVAARI